MLPQAVLKKDPQTGTAVFSFSGEWLIASPVKDWDALLDDFGRQEFKQVSLNGNGITAWDSQLIAFLVRVIGMCKKKGVSYQLSDFPEGINSLLALAFAVPEHPDTRPVPYRDSFLTVLGKTALNSWESIKSAYSFARSAYLSFIRLLLKRAVVRKVDMISEIQEAGASALPIVSLICFMVGLILAFVGSIQLKLFGAQIYVSSLVAIAITRVMGAIMAGVIMAGRTGASYAATIGSMQVNEEVDALETMGISPFDFLVLPRMLALSLMMPLLTVYADMMGIMGGAFVGIFMLGLSPEDYFRMTLSALSMKNIIIGIVYGSTYGIIIALCGCYQGIFCGRNASAVGRATTSAVVLSIVWMTVATAILTFFFNFFGV